jgi:N6-L-threonylcarbamoyladenine synthase
LQRKVRRHNRKLYKEKILRGGNKKRNQAAYCICGFCRYDVVRYNHGTYYINSLRTKGSFQLKTLTGIMIDYVNCKQLVLLEKHKSYITERRVVAPHTT